MNKISKLIRLGARLKISNIPLLLGLILLGLAALFLTQGLELSSNGLAKYAYLFLTVGVVGKAIQYILNAVMNRKKNSIKIDN